MLPLMMTTITVISTISEEIRGAALSPKLSRFSKTMIFIPATTEKIMTNANENTFSMILRIRKN